MMKYIKFLYFLLYFLDFIIYIVILKEKHHSVKNENEEKKDE